MEVVRQLNEGLAFGNSTLSRVREEAIATVVSAANRCRYGALTHVGFLRRYSGDSKLASQLLADHTRADCSPEDRRMLAFVVKLTLEPASLTEKDIDGLRAEGFADEDIVSVVLVTCLCNFMNRVASSLGVEVPSGFQRAVEGWLTGPATQEAWLLGPRAEPSQPRRKQPQPPEEQPQTPPDESAAPAAGVDEGRVPNGTAADLGEAIAPESATAATGSTMDKSLLQFVKECCQESPGEASTARDLYLAYLRWCDENRWGPLHQRSFGLGLAELGFRRRRRGHGRHWWLGITLNTDDSDD